MEFLLAIAIVAVLVAVISAPLRRGASSDPVGDERLADLEARKEAKYREIRDAKLDHAAGKLSDEDYRLQDAELRAEAIKILDELESLQARAAER